MQSVYYTTKVDGVIHILRCFHIQTLTHTHTHTHTYIYIYIYTCVYIYIYTQSVTSTSCRAASTELPDPLSQLVPIIHRPRDVFKATSCITTELLYIGSSWLPSPCSSVWWGPQEYIAFEFVLASPEVSHMSGSSNLDSLRDGWLVAVELLFCGMLPPWLV